MLGINGPITCTFVHCMMDTILCTVRLSINSKPSDFIIAFLHWIYFDLYNCFCFEFGDHLFEKLSNFDVIFSLNWNKNLHWKSNDRANSNQPNRREIHWYEIYIILLSLSLCQMSINYFLNRFFPKRIVRIETFFGEFIEVILPCNFTVVISSSFLTSYETFSHKPSAENCLKEHAIFYMQKIEI